MVFYDWQKRWQKEHPHATLYEAQLDAFLAGREAEKQAAAQQPAQRTAYTRCPACGGMDGYHLDGVDCGEYRR